MPNINFSTLLAQRDEVLESIKQIEVNCEGIDNKSSVHKLNALNMERAKLISDKNRFSLEFTSIEQRLIQINQDIRDLSDKGIERVLTGIKEQRWFFFKNKPDILFDKTTGYLWPNLEHFKYKMDRDYWFSKSTCVELRKTLKIDNFEGWQLPLKDDVIDMIDDNSFPFHTDGHHYILEHLKIYIFNTGSGDCMWLDHDYPKIQNQTDCLFIPVYKNLCSTNYRDRVTSQNKVFNEKERLNFTLEIFAINELEPIFNNQKVTELYKKIYFVKPKLLHRLNGIQAMIDSSQKEVLLSSTFDYNVSLMKYDIEVIEGSIIKYYEAVQNWITELMDKLHYFEDVKGSMIRDFNIISLKLSRKYEDNPSLTESENSLFKNRQNYFKKHFELGMNIVKNKLLSIKRQANDIEDRIEEINAGENAIKEFAILEEENRAGFKFIAENTATIIKKALQKIEYFERNRSFATNIISLEDNWTEEYKIFKFSKQEEFKNLCEDDSIEKELWLSWYEDWSNKRYIIESCFWPLVEKGLKDEILINQYHPNDRHQDPAANPVEKLIDLLQTFKDDLDRFYIEERKNIYQKFAFQSGGNLQDKFEVESELYKITSRFQKDLQEVIFSINNSEDRIFLLKWADSLIDLQIDEILDFVKDKDLIKISQEVLFEFADLKRKNYESFLNDTKAYSEEQANREKQYNSLMFKMRKELMK